MQSDNVVVRCIRNYLPTLFDEPALPLAVPIRTAMPFLNYLRITPPPFWRRWSSTFFTVVLAVAISVFLRILASINFRLVSLFAVVVLPEEEAIQNLHQPLGFAFQRVPPSAGTQCFVRVAANQCIHKLVNGHQDLKIIRMPH